MKQRSNAQRRNQLPNTQIATVEPTVSSQALLPRMEQANDGGRLTHDELTSLATKLEAKIDALRATIDQSERDNRARMDALKDTHWSSVDALKDVQAKQATEQKVIKYVINAIAVFVMGAAGSTFGPKALELIAAMLK